VSVFENIYSQVQVRPDEIEWGAGEDDGERIRAGAFSHLLGLVGNAQLGPIYLGYFGVGSLIFGFFAIEIIGLNMLASVDWSPIQFLRQLP